MNFWFHIEFATEIEFAIEIAIEIKLTIQIDIVVKIVISLAVTVVEILAPTNLFFSWQKRTTSGSSFFG